MLTKSGAKLLDFGLAKPALRSDVALTTMATAAKPLTTEGTIVGAFFYMAPELFEGKEADARSDLFAFGSVLYEMATGKRAFDGKTSASDIAAIMEREPAPITSLQPIARRGCSGNCSDSLPLPTATEGYRWVRQRREPISSSASIYAAGIAL